MRNNNPIQLDPPLTLTSQTSNKKLSTLLLNIPVVFNGLSTQSALPQLLILKPSQMAPSSAIWASQKGPSHDYVKLESSLSAGR